MSTVTFKSSLFGGFNRGDVIRYIEKSALESRDRIAALESDMDKLVKENHGLRDELDAVTGARDRLSGAVHDNLEKQEELRAALDAAKEELNVLRARFDALSSERDALQAEVARLRPQAEEYCAVKSRLPELELAARERADAYETQTRARADAYEHDTRERADTYERETRARVNALVNNCRSQCDLILSTLGEACANVTDVLHKSTETVSRLPAAFQTLRRDLDGLGGEASDEA